MVKVKECTQMAINYPNFAQTPKWALAFPDVGKTLDEAQTRAIKPRYQAEELVKTMLANKVQGAKAQYAQQMEKANLEHILAGTQGLNDTHGMVGLRRQLLEAQANLANKKANEPTVSPYNKAMYAAQAKEDVKNVAAGEQNIPQAQAMLEEIDKALEVLPKHKNWFGPGTLGFDWAGGPGARKRSITDEEYGPVEALLGRLVGPQAQELSHGNKVLATALNLAQGIKPSFNENYPIAYGKLNRIREELSKSLGNQTEKYHGAGGVQQIGNYRGFEPRLSFKNEGDFHSYMKKLTPHQRNIVKKAISGGG